MKLIDIAAKAMPEGKILRRRCWEDSKYIKVNPYSKQNSLVLCHTDDDGIPQVEPWQPSLNSLMADDWLLDDLSQPATAETKAETGQDEAKTKAKPADADCCPDEFELERWRRLLELKALEFKVWEHDVRQYIEQAERARIIRNATEAAASLAIKPPPWFFDAIHQTEQAKTMQQELDWFISIAKKFQSPFSHE